VRLRGGAQHLLRKRASRSMRASCFGRARCARLAACRINRADAYLRDALPAGARDFFVQ
jgi:hypothetical protein